MRKDSPAFFVVIVFLTTILSLPCLGQEYRATITGVVTDASKAVIRDAAVSIRNLDTGEVIRVKTNAAGVYAVPFLHPGQKLEVSVEAPGFRTETYPPVVLSVLQKQTANFVLQVGSATQEVTVSTEGYQVSLDTERADRGTVVDNKTMTQMPLNGRNALSLMDYIPGVTNENGAGNEGSGLNVEGFNSFTVNGTPAGNTEYTIDGMSNNALPWYSMATPSSLPSIDALQEFKVTTTPYDAQNGRTAAGVVSMELKSGTNALHGTVFEFAKRGYMDANSWFNNYLGYPRGAHTEDQYGFEIDGPVYIPHIYNGRNKTFFMFNYERFKEVLPTTQTYDIPNAAWLQGDFSNFVDQYGALMPVFDPSTANTNNPTRQIFQNSSGQYNHVDPSRLNPIAVNAVKMMLAAAQPTPIRFPNELPWEQIWINTIPSTSSSTNYIVKIDQILGSKDHVSGSWIREYYPSFQPNTPADVPWFNGSTYTQYHMNAGVDWVHTYSSSLISDVHVSYQRLWDADGPTPANLNYDPAQLGFSSSLLGQLPLKRGFPIINFNMQQQASATGNGYNNWLVMSRDFYNFPSDTYSVSPTITWNKSKHGLRAGIDIRTSHTSNPLQYDNTMAINANGQATSEYWNQLASNDIPTLPGSTTQLSQSFSGNAVLDFLIGQPNNVAVQNQLFPYYTWHYYAPWIQDDWKITPKFTLNLGFRYDLNGPPTARHNWLNTGFDFNVINPVAVPGLAAQKGGITFPSTSGTDLPWARDYTKWQPRIGFSWQALPGTVLRGGAGRTVLNSTDLPRATGFTYNPVYNNSSDGGRTYFSNNLGNPFPNGIPSVPGASLGLLTNVGQSVTFANPKYKLPSVINGSLGLEQVLPHNGKMEISYVMTRGYGLTVDGDYKYTYTGIDANPALYQSCNALLYTAANPDPQQQCQNLTHNPYYGVPGVTGTLAQNQSTSLYQLARPYPQFTGISETLNNWGRSWYNSLQATYQQRLGWEQINASWTWSKTMIGGGYVDDIYLIPVRHTAGTDRANRITLTSVLNIPVGRGMKYFAGMNRPLDAAIGGWELAADAFWETGQPVKLNLGYNVIGNIRSSMAKHSTHDVIDEGVNPCVEVWHGATPTKHGTYTLPNGQPPSSCAEGIAWQQVAPYAPKTTQAYTDQIRGPRASQIDVNLSKSFKFTERVRMQLRMEEFNVLNHPTWYNQVDMTPTDTNFGMVNKPLTGGQSNNPRLGQLGVKVLW